MLQSQQISWHPTLQIPLVQPSKRVMPLSNREQHNPLRKNSPRKHLTDFFPTTPRRQALERLKVRDQARTILMAVGEKSAAMAKKPASDTNLESHLCNDLSDLQINSIHWKFKRFWILVACTILSEAIRENLSLHVVACRYMSLHSTSARPGTKEAWPPQGSIEQFFDKFCREMSWYRSRL